MKVTRTKFLTMTLVLGVAAAAGSLAAQGLGQPNRNDVEGMMEAYILSKLQESLDLTDEQFGSMVVAQKKLQDTRRGYRQARMAVLRQLRQALSRPQAGEAELQPLLSRLETLRDEFHANEKTRYAAIDEILDIRQRARYRVLEVELQRRLTQMMRQVRGRREQRRRQFDR